MKFLKTPLVGRVSLAHTAGVPANKTFLPVFHVLVFNSGLTSSSQKALPALLQKLVGELFFLLRGMESWREIWREFCGIPQFLSK